jgi:hypothetical protein
VRETDGTVSGSGRVVGVVVGVVAVVVVGKKNIDARESERAREEVHRRATKIKINRRRATGTRESEAG